MSRSPLLEDGKSYTFRSFEMLSFEMLALSMKEEKQEQFYGAVTTGQSWLFGCFDATKKEVIQDTSIYAVPNALQDLMAILLGVLQH